MVSWLDYVGDASDAQISILLAKAKKRRMIYGLLSLFVIPAIFLGGCAIFCNNNIQFIKSRGSKSGGGIFNILMILLGGIIFPLIVVNLCSHIGSLGNAVLGWKK